VIDRAGVLSDRVGTGSPKVESTPQTICSTTSKSFAGDQVASYGPTLMWRVGTTGRGMRSRTRFLSSACVAAIALLGGVVVLPSSPAGAFSTGTDGGSTVRVGVSTGATTGGGLGGPNGAGPSGGQRNNPEFCMYTPIIDPPPIPNVGSWYLVICENRTTDVASALNEFIDDRTTVTAQAVSPRSVALAAEKSLRLPTPTSSFNPPGASIVNLPTWLWINASVWHPYQVTATVGGVSATAVARPIAVVWSTGDGPVTTCAGPGVPYRSTQALPGTACTHTYGITSLGQPSPDGNPNDGSFLVTATIDWSVSWSSRGAAGGGTLPSLTTSSSTRVRVEQVEAINSVGSST
jgi:hypothetical protein